MNLNLKKILIKSKKEVFSDISGNNSSKLKGEGYDFLELREYEYGDDVKHIDWTISAKLQQPYVKVFHAQKELDIHIVSLLSGSLYFGLEKFKNEIVTEVCSVLGFSAIKQGDPFSSYIANEDLTILTKKSKKFFSVVSMCEEIYNYKLINKIIDYKKVCDKLFLTIKRKSVIFLIGDFIDFKNLDLKLLSKKHEVYIVIIRDKFEENPQALGTVNLVDSQNGLSFEGVLDDSTIVNYKKLILENDHKLFTHLQKCNIKSVKIYTNDNISSKLLGMLKK